jgi:hypothetical protein
MRLLDRTCVYCGTIVAPDASQCPACGQDLAHPPISPVDPTKFRHDLGPWRDGELLVMHRDAKLPTAQCIKCDEPALGGRMVQKVSYRNPLMNLLCLLILCGLPGIVVIVLVFALTDKRAKVGIGLCDRHLFERRLALTIAWLLALAGAAVAVVCMILSMGMAGYPDGEMAPLVYGAIGILIFVAGLAVAAFAAPVVKARKIEGDYVWLKAVSPQYLSRFPALTAYHQSPPSIHGPSVVETPQST